VCRFAAVVARGPFVGPFGDVLVFWLKRFFSALTLDAALYSDADRAMYSETLDGTGLERGVSMYGGYGDEGGSEEEEEPKPGPGYGPQPTQVAPVATPSKPAFDSYRFFWNQRWQSCLERTCLTREDARQRVEELKDLLDRFVQTAIPVCETIVQELFLEDAKKTIPPFGAGGIAGGRKFVHKNLFIKIADEATSRTLYGGLHAANKAAAHELKGIQSLLDTNTPLLHFPLLALIQGESVC
jgi:hypothetical protein